MPHKHKKLGIAALKNTKFNKKTISYRKSLKNTPNCISSKLILHTHEFCGLNKADGRKLWQTSVRGRGFAQSNIAYLDGYVYHSHSGALHVLEAITGEIVHKISISPDGSQFYNPKNS